MKIVDITPETEKIYFCCLEDWSDEMKEAGDHKEQWYKRMKGKGVRVKLAKNENDEVNPPAFIRKKKKLGKGTDKVNITVFKTGWCPVMNLAYERTLRAAEHFGNKIDLKEYDTVDRKVMKEWGISDGIFIDGKELRTGPPPKYEKVYQKIEKRIRKLPADHLGTKTIKK